MRDGDKKKFVKKGKGVIDPLALEKNSWVWLTISTSPHKPSVVTHWRNQHS